MNRAKQIRDALQIVGEGKSFDWLAGLFCAREKGGQPCRHVPPWTAHVLVRSTLVLGQ